MEDVARMLDEHAARLHDMQAKLDALLKLSESMSKEERDAFVRMRKGRKLDQ